MGKTKVYLNIDDNEEKVKCKDPDNLEKNVRTILKKKGYKKKKDYKLSYKKENDKDLTELDDEGDWEYLSIILGKGDISVIHIHFESKIKKPDSTSGSNNDISNDRTSTSNDIKKETGDNTAQNQNNSFTKKPDYMIGDLTRMMDDNSMVQTIDLSTYQMNDATEQKVKEVLNNNRDKKEMTESIIQVINQLNEKSRVEEALSELTKEVNTDKRRMSQDEEAVDRNISCNECNKGIRGLLFSCLSCEQHILCNYCQQTYKGDCLFIRSETAEEEKTGEEIQNLNKYLNGDYLSIGDVGKKELLTRILGENINEEITDIVDVIEEESVEQFLRSIINIFF